MSLAAWLSCARQQCCFEITNKRERKFQRVKTAFFLKLLLYNLLFNDQTIQS